MKSETFKPIKDQYTYARGGKSRFLNIYCEHCGSHILLYQKDGPGPLKRMYLDRIIAPRELAELQSKEEVDDLTCKHCNRLIGIPGIFEKESRRAILLLAYTIIKKPGKGIYPPDRKILS